MLTDDWLSVQYVCESVDLDHGGCVTSFVLIYRSKGFKKMLEIYIGCF